jgi:hypothetical protein
MPIAARNEARARGPDHRHRLAGRHLEADVVQDRPVVVVGEADVVEAHAALQHRQRLRARRVGDLAVLAEQREHLLHVHRRLLDLAVDHAQEVERNVELDHQRVDQHQVAERERAIDHAQRGAPHQQRDRGGDDQALAQVEHRQRGLRLDRCLLQVAQVVVVAPLLEALVVEVLDRLVVNQGVDRARVGAAVLLVHRTPEVRAPLGHRHRVGDVRRQRTERDAGKPAVELGRQQRDHQADLDQRGQDVVDEVVQQRVDGARAALDVARHAAGLALEVEAQRQRQQVLEGLQRDLARHARGHRIEQKFAQLGEQRHRHAQRPVGQQQTHRHHQQRARVAWLQVERVDQRLEHQRHPHVGQLGRDQAGQREQHAPLPLPDVGQQLADGGQPDGGRRRRRSARRQGRNGDRGRMTAHRASVVEESGPCRDRRPP